MRYLKPFKPGSQKRLPFVVMDCGYRHVRIFHEELGEIHFDAPDKAYRWIAKNLEPHSAIYTAASYRGVLASIGAYRFNAYRYNRKSPKLVIRGEMGAYIHVKRIPESNFDDIVDALFVVTDFLRMRGIELRGIAKTAENIFCLGMDDSLQFRADRKACQSYRGARNHHVFWPNGFKRVSHWDINSAYVDALTRLSIPTRYSLDHVDNKSLDGEGIAIADVTPKWFSEIDYFRSSPVANSISPDGRTLYSNKARRLVLPISELRMVREYGGTVHLVRTYTGEDYIPESVLAAYRSFAEDIRGIRAVPLAKKLLKKIINAGWSVFGTAHNELDKIIFTDWGGYDTASYQIVNRSVSHREASSFPVASIISGRVRQRMWREAIYPLSVVMCRTDSAFVYRRSLRINRDAKVSPYGPVGTEVGEWSERTRDIIEMVIANDNHYMYRTIDHPNWIPIYSGPSPRDPVGSILRAVKRRAHAGHAQTATWRTARATRLMRNRAEWVDQWML